MSDITTGAQMTKNIQKVLRAGRAGVPRDLDQTGVKVVNRLKLKLSFPGFGAIYETLFFTDSQGVVHPYGKRPPHIASRPGDPPAVDTGTLRSSYGHYARPLPRRRPADRRHRRGVRQILGVRDLQDGGPTPPAAGHQSQSTTMIRRDVKEGFEGRERAMARRLGGRG